MAFTIFLLLKFFAYSAFIYGGLRTFRGSKTGFIVLALLAGFARLVLGLIFGGLSLVFGVAILSAILFGNAGAGPDSSLKVFLSILPSSFILWLIIARILARRIDNQALGWAGCGLAISVAFDLYAIFNIASWNVGGWC